MYKKKSHDGFCRWKRSTARHVFKQEAFLSIEVLVVFYIIVQSDYGLEGKISVIH